MYNTLGSIELEDCVRLTRQNTLFLVTRPGILEEGQSVGAREVATPARALVGHVTS